MELDYFMSAKDQNDRASINEAFLRALDYIVEEILDVKVPFVYDDSQVR
jgi:hypothetical protein